MERRTRRGLSLILAMLALAGAGYMMGRGQSVEAIAPPPAPEVRIVERVVEEAPRLAPGVNVAVPAVRVLKMEATAYTNGPESTGKRPGDPGYAVTYSGVRTRPGTVAVDPEVIPLRSIVWVEGYGVAVAEDTGGAIKGNRIDVWFEDVETALEWGRKKVTVAVLREGPGRKVSE